MIMPFRLTGIKIGITYSTINPSKLDKVNTSNDKAEQVIKAIHKTANTDKLGGWKEFLPQYPRHTTH